MFHTEELIPRKRGGGAHVGYNRKLGKKDKEVGGTCNITSW